MLIRRELPADAQVVAQVQLAAFPGPDESNLAVALRTGGHAIAELCFVCEIDGLVVGHVVCSTGDLDGHAIPGLGPIGVLPAHQHSGVGSALMHAVIGAAEALSVPMIVLLGNPDYYSRFGFVTASGVGIAAPAPEWGRHFQVLTLTAHDPELTGTYEYSAPFNEL